MLLLTGLRLNEAAQLSWPEVQGNIIIIPASRMKGREGKARRTSGAVVVGGAGGHRIAAAHQERAVPVLAQGREAAGDDDRPDEARSGPAHVADLEGDGPSSRRGSSRRRSAGMGQPRSAPHGALRSVGNCASRTTSRKPCLHTGRPASSAPTTCMNIWMRSARRWSNGRSTSRTSSTRSLPRLPKSSSCGGGGDDRVAGVCGVQIFRAAVE